MSSNFFSRILRHLDVIGSVISTACALHCLLLPVLILVLPFVGLAFILDESFEMLLLIAAIAIAFSSFLWGTKTHGEVYVFYFLAIALVCFFLSRLHSLEVYERFLVAGGGIFLVIGHLINRKLCNTCPTCHDCGCSQSEGIEVPDHK
jgi:drug/metabolite transporter superfamily protein YnfA